jgi:hypothetical protein
VKAVSKGIGAAGNVGVQSAAVGRPSISDGSLWDTSAGRMGCSSGMYLEDFNNNNHQHNLFQLTTKLLLYE